jgi:hypothetical protein
MTVSKHWEPKNILIPKKLIIGDRRNQEIRALRSKTCNE